MKHEWPKEGEHLWGRWLTRDRKTLYRQCVHPTCPAIETKDVSGA